MKEKPFPYFLSGDTAQRPSTETRSHNNLQSRASDPALSLRTAKTPQHQFAAYSQPSRPGWGARTPESESRAHRSSRSARRDTHLQNLRHVLHVLRHLRQLPVLPLQAGDLTRLLLDLSVELWRGSAQRSSPPAAHPAGLPGVTGTPAQSQQRGHRWHPPLKLLWVK